MDADPILVEYQSGVALVQLNRARQANALSTGMQRRIIGIIEAAATDQAVDAVVIWGGTGSVFSAGADLRESPGEMAQSEFTDARSALMFDMLRAILASPKPVVAALNGHAVGSGALTALVADARVAAPDASISLPEIKHGAPSFAGAEIVTRRLDETLAWNMLQTGRRMSAGEARQRGLLHAVVDAGDLSAEAVTLASALAEHAAAFRQNKQWVNRGFAEALTEAQHHSAAMRAERRGANDENARNKDSAGVR